MEWIINKIHNIFQKNIAKMTLKVIILNNSLFKNWLWSINIIKGILKSRESFQLYVYYLDEQSDNYFTIKSNFSTN